MIHMSWRFEKIDDSRLAARVARGDEAAFEVLYDRHHRSLLSFCRHMLGSTEDGEDALQQTFLRAHGALRAGQVPDAVAAVALRDRPQPLLSMLAAAQGVSVPLDEVSPSFDGLADGVELRADLRELVGDLGRLPEDQRAALVLFELGGLSQAEIGAAIDVPAGKVKALVFQARAELMAERDARSTPCSSIREELAVARGGALRRGPLRRHLRLCEPCQAYRAAVATQRAGLASILPVAPALGLKGAVLAAAAAKGVAGAAGGGALGGGAAGGGIAAGAGAGGSAVAACRRLRADREDRGGCGAGRKRRAGRARGGRRCGEARGRERVGDRRLDAHPHPHLHAAHRPKRHAARARPRPPRRPPRAARRAPRRPRPRPRRPRPAPPASRLDPRTHPDGATDRHRDGREAQEAAHRAAQGRPRDRAGERAGRDRRGLRARARPRHPRRPRPRPGPRRTAAATGARIARASPRQPAATASPRADP